MRVLTLAALLSLACGRAEIYGERVQPAPAPQPRPDSGFNPPRPDAGTPVRDGGTPAPDAGQPEPDGGVHLLPDGGVCKPPAGTSCQFTNPPQSFSCIPGVRVLEQKTDRQGRRQFVLGFRQPVDHFDPASPTFEQRLSVSHVSANQPTVLLATGYELYDTIDELYDRFIVNEISVEHRFFGTSFPDGGQYDYRHLDIRQASEDLHRIREAFAGLYPKSWVSTGASKGGMTMVYYRRFYPCDVAGTVAYVAPHSDAELDPRYNTFLDAVGGTARADCRDRLGNLERQLLDRRAALLPQFPADAGYGIVGSVEAAYESSVVFFFFTYWQYIDPDDPGFGCAALPTGTLSDAVLAQWARSIVGGVDDDLLPFAAYYYQAATQLGDAEAYTRPVPGRIQFPAALTTRAYVPRFISIPAFDPAPMRDIQAWLSAEGDGIAFVYGELDPWSATQYELGASHDTKKSIAPGLNHYASLADLQPADEEATMQMIERWFGIKRSHFRSLAPPPLPPRHASGPPLPRR